MDVTRITPANAGFFEDIVPSGSFGDDGLLWLGAIAEDGTACAALGGGILEDMAFIDWIYTSPGYREMGAADSLLKVFCSLFNRIDENVEIVEISLEDTEEGLSEFLEAKGFLIAEDSGGYEVPLVELIYSDVAEELENGRSSSGKVISAATLKDPDVLFDYISNNNIPCYGNREELTEYSLVSMDNEDNITGCMLIVKGREGDILVPYLLCDGSPGGITDFFLALKEMATKKRWEEENIVFYDRSGQMIGFVEQITNEDGDIYHIKGQKEGYLFLSE